MAPWHPSMKYLCDNLFIYPCGFITLHKFELVLLRALLKAFLSQTEAGLPALKITVYHLATRWITYGSTTPQLT